MVMKMVMMVMAVVMMDDDDGMDTRLRGSVAIVVSLDGYVFLGFFFF